MAKKIDLGTVKVDLAADELSDTSFEIMLYNHNGVICKVMAGTSKEVFALAEEIAKRINAGNPK